ncbi:MAG: N-acetylmuramoyl-L-alanine amidase-like domain-containing protein [Planctomycetota bacterium]
MEPTLRKLLLFFALMLFVPAARAPGTEAKSPNRVDAQLAAQCEEAGVDPHALQPLLEKPLYEFSEAEVDIYLRWLHAAEPSLRKRIVHLARKNLGQPYDIYLLGEMPFEPYDPQPIYCLDRSDCLVYSEHTYAMALGNDWPRFMAMLQRIRYRDGQIGVATRNHYTEADWNISNRWLAEDITAAVAGDAAQKFKQRIDRARFLRSSFNLEVDIPVENREDVFLPYHEIDRADAELREGDFVNIVRGHPPAEGSQAKENAIFGGSAWVGHVGLVVRGEGGSLNFIHSTKPKVREQTFASLVEYGDESRAEKLAEGKPVLLGFKFLRLRDEPMDELKKIDGEAAPRVTLPKGGQARF